MEKGIMINGYGIDVKFDCTLEEDYSSNDLNPENRYPEPIIDKIDIIDINFPDGEVKISENMLKDAIKEQVDPWEVVEELNS